jgi:hypothetical protein
MLYENWSTMLGIPSRVPELPLYSHAVAVIGEMRGDTLCICKKEQHPGFH